MVEKRKAEPANSRAKSKKAAPAAPSKRGLVGKSPASRAKPKPAMGKKVTSASKPKPTPKPEPQKSEPKSAAKPAAKAAPAAATKAERPAPAAPAKATKPPAPAVQAAPPPAPEPPPPAPEPAPEPPKTAAAPMTHSGVPAGPMRPQTPPRAMAKAEIFVDGDFVVYPTHGVGKVERIATEEIAGHTLELIHITFDENRMTLRVPTNKARTAGLRKLASRRQFDEVLATLKGRARIKRTMWSRRAQEYEAKINSGDPSAIAEVVRDLHRNAGQPDQSFSERQIYESALDRLAAEYGALEQVDKATATERLIAHLKSE
jgi:CarD family transcriptional regulator